MDLFCQFLCFSLIIALGSTSCASFRVAPLVTSSPANVSTNGLTRIPETKKLSVWAAEADQETAQDIIKAIDENAHKLCTELQTECQFPVIVEVYPDQASFDEHVMNAEMRGFFAISGPPYTIQMVSPANPAPHMISYEDGVSVAVHEFVHLVLDEINPELPTWLDEGTAVYLGPHELYAAVCRQAFPFELTPSIQQLQEEYNNVPAADLFAYTVVNFIVSEYGIEKLNLLLRTPEELERILGVTRETFEESWQRYIHTQCHNNQPKELPDP